MQSAADRSISPERLTILIAAASVLQLSESMLPYPIPGLRLGFANIISLIVLFQFGFRAALTVTLLRSVVSSFIIGSFLSPGFLLSFTAGLISITGAALCLKLSSFIPLLQLSPLGVSIIGAFLHNMAQLLLAYLLFFHHSGMFVFVPWLILGAVILGGISGGLAMAVLNRLDGENTSLPLIARSTQPYNNRVHHPGNSPFHKMSPVIKIGLLLCITVLTVFFENLYFYGALFCTVILLVSLSSLEFVRSFSVLKKLWGIIMGAFVLPLFFNHGSQAFLNTPIHQEAVIAGLIFSSRIILLALLSNLLAQTTSVEKFTDGIRFYIRPLEVAGINSRGVAKTIADTLSALPQIWLELRSCLNFLLTDKPRTIKTIATVAVQLFLYLFITVEQSSNKKKDTLKNC